MNYIRFFEDITLNDIALVGGKNAALGQMIRDLADKVRIPNGFAITVDGYHALVRSAGLTEKLNTLTGAQIREAIISAPMPDDLKEEITKAYTQLTLRPDYAKASTGKHAPGPSVLSSPKYQGERAVAVRSSATAEDLPTASFAGQQDSFLYIQGIDALLVASKKCMASLFNDRAIAYRQEKGFDLKDIALSVGVQKMVNASKATSGVMFTLETESGNPDFITINASFGLGESVVQGSVNPDEYMVHKGRLQAGFKPLVKKVCGDKKVMTVHDKMHNRVHEVPVLKKRQRQFCLTDDQIFELAHYGMVIEKHFGRAMDIEWAQDARDKKLYIVQARPETVHQTKPTTFTAYTLHPTTTPILTGLSIGRGVVSGKVRIIDTPAHAATFKAGEILVTHMTDPDWVPLMKRAAAIITDQGGRTCHAAIVARELGVPALVGSVHATTTLHDGQEITLDCSNGTQGAVYAGKLPLTTQQVNVPELPQLPVDLLVNIANPDAACQIALLPINGAGLVRLEFIIAQRIGIHPMAIIHPEKVKSTAFKRRVKTITATYKSLKDWYIETLSEDIGLIACALYPRPAVVRLTDFKSNEYRDLLGGSVFEPQEENPMLGLRGASRYTHELYEPAFALECAALQRARERMGLDNIIIMIPFVRTVTEAEKTISLLQEHGLSRAAGLQIYLMVELPTNVIIFEKFEPLFDGFSIGSNDLTQLTLGVDRDSGLLHNLFNEKDQAVMALIQQAIHKAHVARKHISICGQAPSDYPDFAQWLIAQKIDALSLNPDALLPFYLSLSGTK